MKSSSSSSLSVLKSNKGDRKNSSSKRQSLVTKGKEKSWYIPPSEGIPAYQADKDPFCPIAKIKKFNDEQKLRVKETLKQQNRSETWIKKTLAIKFEDVPLRMNVDLRTKAIEAAGNNGGKPVLAEVEILQKIIVRERLLTELSRLLKTGSEVTTVLGEVIELVKALRFETLEIIEEIVRWQNSQATRRPFLFKGLNYLIKIAHDLDFLDNYDDVVERFCFEFKANPLAFRGGGNVITGCAAQNSESYLRGLLKSYYDGGLTTVDGIDVMRLHNAEKMIQNEFNQIAEQAKLSIPLQSNTSDEATAYDSIEQEFSSAVLKESSSSVQKKNRNVSGVVSKKSAFNTKRVKLERIQVLKEEIDELQAMMAHIQEKVDLHMNKHKDYQSKKVLMEDKLSEAKQLNREVAAQHLAAEMFVLNAEIAENLSSMKTLQKEGYFIGLEKKRKAGVLNKMREEMAEEKRRSELKKQIEDKIKNQGLLAALNSLQITTDERAKSTKPTSKKKGTNTKRPSGKKATVNISFSSAPSSTTSFCTYDDEQAANPIWEEEGEEDEEEEEEEEEDEEEEEEEEEEGGGDEHYGGSYSYEQCNEGGQAVEQDDHEEGNRQSHGPIHNEHSFENSDGELECCNDGEEQDIGGNSDVLPNMENDHSPFIDRTELSAANSLCFSQHEDDHSEVFPALRQDLSFVSEASDATFAHVAGSGVQLARALKK